jgi:excinuclease ABC subunit C
MGKERPCLYYQIGQCSGPCNGLISKEAYQASIRDAIAFLNGNYKQVANELTQTMKDYSAELEFEKAAEIRDLIDSIYHVMDKQRISDTEGDDRDIIAMAKGDQDCVISVFFIREGQLLGRENHHMSADANDSPEEILTAFVKQYYTATPNIPREILTEYPIQEEDIVTEYLSSHSGHRVYLAVPKKGDKHRLLTLAQENARLVLSQDMERIKRQEKRTLGATQDIAQLLGIPSASRMEAFDISNISGFHSVASMVVFENGQPKRSAYRKFRLRTVDGPDDYASMKEVLSRRFTDEKMSLLPDVLMMDGGKGQVNIAQQVLDSLGLEIPVCGMVKDDHHRTRGLYYNNQEVQFPKGSEALHMVTALQDEAHRFAIEYHKQLRTQNQVHSILDDIKGIGPARRKALMMHFKDIEAIKAASQSELAAVPGMTEQAALAVYDFFHG